MRTENEFLVRTLIQHLPNFSNAVWMLTTVICLCWLLAQLSVPWWDWVPGWQTGRRHRGLIPLERVLVLTIAMLFVVSVDHRRNTIVNIRTTDTFKILGRWMSSLYITDYNLPKYGCYCDIREIEDVKDMHGPWHTRTHLDHMSEAVR